MQNFPGRGKRQNDWVGGLKISFYEPLVGFGFILYFAYPETRK